MPVVPFGVHLFRNCQELYQFLFACKQIAIEKDRTQLVSISLETPTLDPLGVLQVLHQPQHLHVLPGKEASSRQCGRPRIRVEQ
ncbi:hypothetical protein [Neosynechococcus sphagnicola]|uniref:hypothetical protein n=1 Tax=Neosynechococcus sphagnicola TaxID=1501145 RepID=UPI0019554162|nr:hypothetical protein [Neosynechococcus sphagnicola]